MMRSLFSAVAGLKAHQTKMDVIGNNISNVNTYGYKSSRTTFRDVYYQTLSSSANPSGSKGGRNAMQVGYGAQVGSIDVLNSRSGFGATGNSMDCYIDGEGYFVVRDGAGNERLTQVGTIDIDSDGNVIDGGGNFVCGYKVKGSTEKASVGGAAIDFGEANNTLLDGYTVEVKNGAAGSTPTINANSTAKTITVTLPSDGSTTTNLQTELRKLSTAATWTVGTMPAGLDDTKITVTSQNPVLQDTGMAVTVGSDTKVTVGGATIDFANIGALAGYSVQVSYGTPGSAPKAVCNSSTKTIVLSIPSDAPTTDNLQAALAGITVNANWVGTPATGVIGSTPVASGTVNATTGKAAEAPIFDTTAPTKITNKVKLKGIAIGPDGSITGEDDGGRIVTIGQIAIANVPNPAALTQDGNSYFKVVNNTGEITYHAPGTGNVGSIATGGLEMSNVDLATEFSDMIIAQRGFQANSKIITVADSMLEELVNLKR
ncbi:MAG TPA: flagellar hook-basal body complex protein [Oscillospiraceae bacterium]|nr:flagellar hook-basal body complex protein [Oscillospiraceae bacterium]